MTTVSNIVLVFTTLGMAIWLRLAMKNRKRWLLSIGPLTYFLSIFVFYGCKEVGNFTPEQLNMLSNVIRLESIFLFSILGITMWKRGPIIWT
jgi:hypothetical protein